MKAGGAGVRSLPAPEKGHQGGCGHGGPDSLKEEEECAPSLLGLVRQRSRPGLAQNSAAARDGRTNTGPTGEVASSLGEGSGATGGYDGKTLDQRLTEKFSSPRELS